MPWPDSAQFDQARGKFIYRCECGATQVLTRYREQPPRCKKSGCGKRTTFEKAG